MAKGFLKGALWGSAISFCAVVGVSILGDGRLVHNVQANAPEPGTTPRALANGSASNQQLSVAQLSAPKAPERDTLSAMSSSDTAPAAQPLVGAVSVLGVTSETENLGQGGAIAPRSQERQIQSAGQTQSLTSPLIETALSISTEPAQPPLPSVAEETGLYAEPEMEPAPDVQTDIAVLFAPETQAVTQAKPVAQATPVAADDPAQPQISIQTEQSSGFGASTDGDATPSVTPVEADATFDVAAVLPEQTLQVPVPNRSTSEPVGIPAEPNSEQTASVSTGNARTIVAPVSEATNVLVVPEDAAEAPVLELETGTAPDIRSTQEVVSQPVAPIVPEQPESTADAESTDTTPTPAVPAEPRVVVQAPQTTAGETDPTDGPAIGKRVGVLGNRADGVQINRLPSLTDQAPEEAPVLDTVVVTLPSLAVTDETKPLVRFAEPAANPDNKPVMAIVLMDQGGPLDGDAIGLPALRSFPYPVSFAIDAFAPDAGERMAAYRAEGFEVLAMVNLPDGAQARDAEVSMAVALAALPEAVGVLEGLDAGVQTTRDAAAQVTEILAQSGHGFVTQNKGLNTVQKLAAKAGVPSAVVFRDFDDKGQTPSVIRRFLDQAAFRAGQEGGVIMLGRLREDTIAALLVWALQDRAEQVALTPVSAVLAVQP